MPAVGGAGFWGALGVIHPSPGHSVSSPGVQQSWAGELRGL